MSLSSSNHNNTSSNDNTSSDKGTTTVKSNTNTTLTSSNDNNISSEIQQRLVYGKNDALFGYIEKQQRTAIISTSSIGEIMDSDSSNNLNNNNVFHFGHVLDAGTGLHSLRWLASLIHTQPQQQISSITAITADISMYNNCYKECKLLGMSSVTKILYGNWFTSSSSTNTTKNEVVDETPPTIVQQLLQNPPTNSKCQSQLYPLPKQYNVILADYLIGAMDGFIPYQQDLIIPQLLNLLAPHGRLYIVGLEPIPDSVMNHNNSNHDIMDGQNLICRVRQARDACIVLAKQRCYREYPLHWILRQVEMYNNNNTKQKEGGVGVVRVVTFKQFPILYRHNTIMKQIQVGRSKIQYLPTQSLRDSMEQLFYDLEQESIQYFNTVVGTNGRIQFGFDYVVVIERSS